MMLHFIKMNRKYQSEAGSDGAASGPGAAPTGALNGPGAEDAAKEAEAKESAAKEAPADEGKAKAERLALADPVKEPAKEPTNDDTGIDQYVVDYAKDNPALEVALGFLKEHGIKTSDVAFQKAEEGDFSLLEALLAKEDAKGADKMLAIMKSAVDDANAKAEEHHSKAAEEVNAGIGENAPVVIEWVKENALPEEKSILQDMINAGGLYARAAGMLMNSAYGASGQSKPAANPVQFSAPVNQGGPLTARDYAEAVDALSKKLGGTDPRGHHEYKALTLRREASRRAGH